MRAQRAPSTSLVLAFEYLYQINELVVLLEDRKNVLLLVLLVVLFNKAVAEGSGVVEHFRRHLFLATVDTEIVSGRGESAAVEYRLLHKDNDWKAYDIIIEGVSLVIRHYR